MTNATYTDYPFTSNGVNFISRINSDSPLAKRISQMPADVIASVNVGAIAEMIGDASLLTREELLSELERVNAGATHAFILLGENK
jgi:hypothetical protein